MCTRVAGTTDDTRSQRIRMLVEAVDPSVVIALDMVAAVDLAAALEIDPLCAGVPRAWGGRTVLAVEGLEASLVDDDLKRRVWRQLKALGSISVSET